MNRISKIAPVLSILLLISTLCQPIGAIELPPSHPSQAPSVDTSGGLLPEAPSTDPLFAKLYECINIGGSSVIYESPSLLATDYTRPIMISLLEDHPEFFYLDYISMSYSAEYNADGSFRAYVYEFEPAYTLGSQEMITAAKAEWETMLNEILQIVTPDMSDLEKALFLHDYLCTNFSYDATLTISDSYTFLKEKTGVCEAYADTYSALLTRLNIDNLFAVSQEMNHVWNVIRIDGEWYHVDITRDDPLNEQMLDQPGKALHIAFLRSDTGMEGLGYSGWKCDVACTSDKYENTVFSEIVSAFVTDGTNFFAVSGNRKSILRLDLDTMTAESIVDLTAHRWYVWGETAYWNACYTNLYCDGDWLYYSTPLGIEAYDLASGGIMTICSYDKGDGYLYAMRFEDHHLICTVSTQPLAAESEFVFQTRHRFGEPTVNGVFIDSTCIECEVQEHQIAPTEGNTFAMIASSRLTPDSEGRHDIRIVMAIDRAKAKTLGQLEYTFTLERSDGTVDTLVFHSENDSFDEFTRYPSFTAGGKVYEGADNHALYGFFVSSIANSSWTRLSFTVKSVADQSILYNGSLEYSRLVTTVV